jgi:hypothetical protein
MYCTLKTTTLITYATNPDFARWCAPANIKPRIYVNAANFYFNITGEMAFENIAFTGINGMLVTGTGIDYSIKEYANSIMRILKISLKIILDKSKPDGTPKKILDISLAQKYGWNATTDFKNGIIKTYSNFLKNQK